MNTDLFTRLDIIDLRLNQMLSQLQAQCECLNLELFNMELIINKFTGDTEYSRKKRSLITQYNPDQFDDDYYDQHRKISKARK